MKVGRTTLLVGTGGVGKTSTSAALALASANTGENVACVSLDPARRLADALGLEASTEVVPVEDVQNGRLRTWMPDSRTSVNTLLRTWLPEGDPLLDNLMVKMMGDALGGMHELASLVHLPVTLPEGLDHLVVDTAPGIHALEALGAPQRLRDLFDGPFIKRLIQIFNLVGGQRRRRPRFFGSQRIIDTMSRAFGERMVTQLSELMSGLGRLQPKLLAMAEESNRVLRSESTKVYVVTVPARKPTENALRILSLLESRGFRIGGILLNRMPHPVQPATDTDKSPSELRAILERMRDEAALRVQRAEQAAAFLRRRRADLSVYCLPECTTASPKETVYTLSEVPELQSLVTSLKAVHTAA